VGSHRLSDEERAHFAAAGWLLCDGLLAMSASELRAEVDRIATSGDDGDWEHHFEMTEHGRRLARTENFTPSRERLSSLLREGAVPEVAGGLLGEPAVLYKEKINYKSAGGAGFAPHQDKPAYPFVDRVLSVMVAVDNATRENGCLEVVSGCHHQLLTQDDRGCIAADVVASLTWDPIELRAGETLFFDALTPHRSGPNRSSLDRWALYPTYNGISEGDLRDEYYAVRRRAVARGSGDERVVLSLIGDFEGRPA
jgi:ectoine hydroxylase-related dioxygenase (phytanoyl-CoA dioxygenase family)